MIIPISTSTCIEKRTKENAIVICNLERKTIFDLGRVFNQLEHKKIDLNKEHIALIHSIDEMKMIQQALWIAARENATAIQVLTTTKIQSLIQEIELFGKNEEKRLMSGNWIHIDENSGIERAVSECIRWLKRVKPSFYLGPNRVDHPYTELYPQPTPMQMSCHHSFTDYSAEEYAESVELLKKEVSQMQLDHDRLKGWIEGYKKDYKETKEVCRREFCLSAQQLIQQFVNEQQEIDSRISSVKRKIPQLEYWGPDGQVELNSYVRGCEWIKGLYPPLIVEIKELTSKAFT